MGAESSGLAWRQASPWLAKSRSLAHNNGMQRTPLRAAADAKRYTD